MKNKLVLLVIGLWITAGCQQHSEIPTGPGPWPRPTEKFVGKLYFHDLVGGQYDIFMADLYLVPKKKSGAGGMVAVKFPDVNQGRLSFRRGISRLTCAEIGGQIKERPVVNAAAPLYEVDISQYDFALRNIENLTDPTFDDFAVAVNNRNWIAYVRAPDFHAPSTKNWEIFYMDLADRIPRQLTPLHGQYGGDNADPDWKDDQTIVWVHNWQAVEVNLNNLDQVTDPISDWDGAQLDPNYSPDRSMILFNSWRNNKKNSYIKYIQSGVFETVLPQEYFALYADDNPTWIFSNTGITGHIFMERKGRIYTRSLQNSNLSIITDSQHDFRYVTPVHLGKSIYLVFSDWTDANRPRLWICSETGAHLRELGQAGDEAVFHALGLPAPQDAEDLERLARDYSLMFNHQ